MAYPRPAAVTVHRSVFDVPVRTSPRNDLEIAASFNQRDLAIHYLMRKLALKNARLAEEVLPEAYRWTRFSKAGRLSAIADWIRAECFELMDLVDGE